MIANREGQTAVRVAALLGHRELEELLKRNSAERVEALLDQALEATFRASDPIAVSPR